MKESPESSLNRIKPNASGNVKWTAIGYRFLVLISFWIPLITLGEFEESEIQEPLPEIEANTFPVKVIRRSNSNRTYLLEDSTNHLPKVGRILLFKQETNQIMALRVIKSYPEEKYFAAKRVMIYNGKKTLERDESFTAVEKIADIFPTSAMPPSSAVVLDDKKEITDLEAQAGLKGPEPVPSALPSPLPSSFPSQLPAPLPAPLPSEAPLVPEVLPEPLPEPSAEPSPTPTKTPEDTDEPDAQNALTVEEDKIIDPHHHWFTLGLGYIRNLSPAGTNYYAAANSRYGINFLERVFFNKSTIQDSWTLEGGVYLYKAIGIANDHDAYTLLVLAGDIRYNLIFSPSFGIFFYGGVRQSNVTGNAQGDPTILTLFNSLLPAGGGGFFFQLGPGWYARCDLGIDSAGLNLVLRF